jgi:hypothetical protein
MLFGTALAILVLPGLLWLALKRPAVARDSASTSAQVAAASGGTGST